MGAEEEARQHIVALAQRLHQFGHRTEEREQELWHRLGGTVALPEMEHRLTNYQQQMENE